MESEILSGILVASVVAFLGYIAKMIWEFVTKDIEDVNDRAIDTKKVKVQFFVSFIAMSALFVACAIVDDSDIRITLCGLALIPFITTWGAFDALYSYADKTKHNQGKDVSDKGSDDGV